jgi:penicillin-binding protein 1A
MAATSKMNHRKDSRKRFLKRKAFLPLLIFIAVATLVAWFFANAYTKEYRQRAAGYDLARINDLEIPSLILDRNGREIGRFFVQNRSVVSIDQVPQVFINALMAGEDSRFESHSGVDWIGILRALKLNAQGATQGASTITQQLARNAYSLKEEALLRKESSIQRKLVEAFLAMRIEEKYSKRQILEFYLNRIYFGSGFYGIRSASLGYYGKEPMDLKAEECASMVTLIKNPNRRSPLNNPGINRDGRNYVLMRMNDEGMISDEEYEEMVRKPLGLNPKPLRRGTSHLYERVADAVGAALGEDALSSGGFTVHTTILAEAQRAAETALRDSLLRAESRSGYAHEKHDPQRKLTEKPANCLQGAVLMIDHGTGEVLAHVGGRDYAQVPYDFIELGRRPLGTAFFPFIYAAALENGMTPVSMTEDEPMDNRSVMVGGREGILGEWGMELASPVYEGRITLRRAFEQSKIAATVRLTDRVGLKRVVDKAVDFGFPIGKAELLPRLGVGFEEASLKQAVRAISAFPRGGKLPPEAMVYIDRVENPKGQTVYRRSRPRSAAQENIMDPATAWQVHSMMAGSLYRGSSKGVLDDLLEKPFQGAGKGGTTHDFGDCWFMGYNARVSCAVWTGFLTPGNGAIYPGAFSRDLAMPVWRAAMNAAAPSFGGGKIEMPANVVEVPVCTVSGERATQFCHDYAEDPATGVVKSQSTAVGEYFRAGADKFSFCSQHSGAGADMVSPENAILNLPALDAVPLRPKAAVLLGDDPYHTEVPGMVVSGQGQSLLRRRSTNVLDSLDLGEVEDSIPLTAPGRLQINDE